MEKAQREGSVGRSMYLASLKRDRGDRDFSRGCVKVTMADVMKSLWQ